MTRIRFFCRYLMIGLMLWLTACGGGGSSDPATPPPVVVTPPAPPPTGLWVTGKDGDALAAFRASVNAERNAVLTPVLDVSAPVPPPTGVAAPPTFSGTYTLEAAIDEHDIVKYNGDILAVARESCCGLQPPGIQARAQTTAMTILPAPRSSEVILYRTTSASGQADFLGTLPIDENMPVEGLYLSDHGLQVLASSSYWGIWGGPLGIPENWQAQQVALSSWDISDAANPTQVGLLSIEGALLLSRRTEDRIQLITRHTPVIEGLTYYPQDDEQRAANEALLAEVGDEVLLPTVTWNDEPVALPDADICYRTDPEHPLAIDTRVEVSTTLLLSLNARTGEVIESSCVLDPVSGVMLSEDSLLLTYVEYAGSLNRTLVHALSAADFAYRGSALVDGQLYSSGNADFRINQFEGVIRLVTTQRIDDEADRLDHTLYTLRPNANRPELDIIGQLPEDGAEEELGKPNEDLYGVRFVGDRAFIVTFERIDPLYVIDLSNPERPTVTGLLEVPGFSDLLHPIGENLLLGVGLSAESHAKVELFDVSDITQPSSLGVLEFLADFDSSYSPAQYNRYAFTTLPEETGERFIIPVTGWRSTDFDFESAAQMVFFRVDTQTVEPILSGQGAVDFADSNWVSDRTRSIIDGEAVYVITGGELLAGFWSNPESLQRVGFE